MLELMMKMDVKFTDEEKTACLPMIDRLFELGKLARANGILTLAEPMETEENAFLKEALGLVVDSNSIDKLDRALQYMILADDCKGAELLERFIIVEGALCIANGENHYYLCENLAGMLGVKYRAAQREKFIATAKSKAYKVDPLTEKELEEMQ